MTVYIEKPAVNLREELASLRNQGGYQEQQFYFDNLVTNGTFDTDVSGWLAGGTSTITFSSGEALVTGGNLFGAYQTLSGLTIGKLYMVSGVGRVGTSSDVVIRITSDASLAVTQFSSNIVTSGTNETLSVVFAATQTNHVVYLRVSASGVTGFFDNISVREVDASNDVIHTMPKGWVPKDVFEDGLLQREGAANDYEVVYDGFDYAVKPAVAPSATTQTCVIGVRK